MRTYYVDGYGSWFAVNARTKREARSIGVSEYGRGHVKEVRLATEEEKKEFIRLRGERALQAN